MRTNLLLHNDVQATGALRFANFIIDVIAVYLLAFIVMIIAYLMTYLDVTGPALWFDNISGGEDRIFSIILFFFYYFIFEATTQRTLGKLITGTMVVNENGEKPSAKTIAGRSLCRLIGLEALTFLGNRRGWHDSASNTYVVKTKKWKQLTALENSFDEIGEPEADTVTTSAV